MKGRRLAQTHKRESLATGRLAVREDDGVVAIHGCADMAASHGIVYRFVFGTGEYLVEMKVLWGCGRSLAILGIQLDALVFCDLPCGGGVGWSYSGRSGVSTVY